ncbi:hypothetical protein [Paenibacillus macquariensis]|uniref:MerR family transcriptional regulator n=1 Tax=Paenibacillus macquariensis TaxID=948756 RepID=A0ABY1KEL9_9BACL|nr:hypothetical protein [Paenibacillus macquariensis]OAB28466.1 hypothetical protein PMSM_24385 [Paenibacillus macquariensis subsp. macquariensis]SIR71880.1 hypothetical protein SAMN05421578_1445 [Paenibacillus macquariensis]
MVEEKKFWQLTEFARLLDGHYTTVNQWFNTLEKKNIHFVSRAADETRVYDELDLSVGRYIKEKRTAGWSLNGIYDKLPDEFDLRPFPEGFTGKQNELSVELLDSMKRLFQSELIDILDQRDLERENNNIKQKLMLEENNLRIRLEERQQNITDRITDHRINSSLKLEALDEWIKLPLSDRSIKIGLFRKEEDHLKREKFIIQYVKDHYADRLSKELGADI